MAFKFNANAKYTQLKILLKSSNSLKTFCKRNKWAPLFFHNLNNKQFCTKTCGKNFINYNNKKYIFYEGFKLPSGRYCMHKSVFKCNMKLHYGLIFRNNKNQVKCVNKKDILFSEDRSSKICSIADSSHGENQKNNLWDYKYNKLANYNRLGSQKQTQKNRFKCKCHGKTLNGLFLSNTDEFPFHCHVDRCKSSATSLSFFDQTKNQCICEKRTFNKYPNEPSSQCTDCAWIITKENTIQGIIDCHTYFDFYERINTVPCGVNNLSNINNTSLCQKAKINIRAV